MNIIQKIFGTHSQNELKRVYPIADAVMALDEDMQKLSDEELKAKTKEFKERLENGETLDDILPEAYAVVREAASRVLGMKHYRVQIVGGIILHQGRIAEMRTGEGKTLVATLPSYLNALEGKGVHVVTVNDYLAKRDAEWMGQVHEFLGLTVGVVLNSMDNDERRAAYECDITYVTNNELGFDYLRDNMVIYKEQLVQRGLNYALIDEVDSVLIDEARTPLIISGQSEKSTKLYEACDILARQLERGEASGEFTKMNAIMGEDIEETGDFIVNEKEKNINLTEDGVKKVEKFFHIENLADSENLEIQHNIILALRAHNLMFRDKDYVVKDDEVLIVDEFTGRIMPGRRYSDGLHQAIEAKEHVKVKRESKTLATITFQNLFNKYAKKSGMTGTALTEEKEFREIYGMDVIEIPTNLPVQRKDLEDAVYKTQKEKFRAVCDAIEEAHAKHQPVLVGTITIDNSELLSGMLKRRGIKHNVLNAKFHELEAEIVAQAGVHDAVTIATNMAGRGTDIKLGEGVKELGGLCVIGTERHESRRIDNQLRGRAGRQGDPGMSQFFVSFEDDLMRRFGTDRIKMMLQSLGVDDDMAIRSKTLTKSIETAQKRVEGNNYDIRKSLLDYDNVLNEQREIIYNKRNEIIDNESISQTVIDTFKETINVLCENHIAPEGHLTENDKSEIVEYVNTNFLKKQNLKVEDIIDLKDKDVPEYISSLVIKDYEEKVKGLPVRNEFERAISLRVIDSNWVEHMNTMEHLKEGIGLRGYSQTNPVQAYTMEGFELFDKLLDKIDNDISVFLLKAEIRQNTEMKQTIKGSANDGKEKIKSTPKKVTKIGRNDPCPCGSGKKYKQCCGK